MPHVPRHQPARVRPRAAQPANLRGKAFMALSSRSKSARAEGSSPGRGTIRRGWSGAYIVDFVCFTHKLIVELDGPQHLDPEAVEHDKRRTTWLAARGFHIIRFRNQELDENIRGVVDAIGRAINELAGSADSPLPNPLRRGEGAEPGLLRCRGEGAEPS